MTVVKAENTTTCAVVFDSALPLHGITSTTSVLDLSSPKTSQDRVTKQSTRVPHPRSKTGCLTCRRRKKKCDETKPSCRNCLKNNVFCQGYEERRDWESKGRGQLSPRPIPPLPQMIGAVDTSLDQHLLSYFMSNLSNSLNIYYERHNPFIDLVIPVALRHTGLMHSVLCLASSCLMTRQATPTRELILRQSHHFGHAIVDLRRHIDASKNRVEEVTDCTILQTILHCLETTITGNNDGDYRCHLQATQRLITEFDNSTAEIYDFGRVFVNYQNFANIITSLQPAHDVSHMITVENPSYGKQQMNQPPTTAGSLAALESLLGSFANIRRIRDEIRSCRVSGRSWCVDEQLLHLAFSIDSSLRSWVCNHPLNTSQYHASLLYRQCAWIYLFRTVKPSAPGPELAQGVNEGLAYLSVMLQSSNARTHNYAHGTLLPFAFLLGCAAFEPAQRKTVASCFDVFQKHSFGNVGHARQVVTRMWQIMDDKDTEDDAWDWEAVMADMGLDLLIS